MYHLYADDTQLYVYFDLSDPTSMMDSQNRILNCVAEIKRWMALNRLKLNADKTEVIMISSTFRRHHPTLTDFHIGDDRVSPSVNVRNLGVVFDIHLSMNSHITKVCSAAYYHLRSICRIRNVLTLDAAKSITHAFVTARLDYCNSLLSGMPKSAISKLQRVQNMAAKMVTRMKKFDHGTPILKYLHWLPIEYRIQFKVLLLAFRAMNGTAPQYLTDMISIHQPRRLLRNSHALELNIPQSRLRSAGDRTFSFQAASR